VNKGFQFVKAEPVHIPWVADFMCPEDQEEVWATAHVTPQEALEQSLAGAHMAWTITCKGRPVAIFGANGVSMTSSTAVPWLLGTTEYRQHGREIFKYAREYIDRMLLWFDHLANFVDSRNQVSVKWLEWCGFTIYPAVPWGVEGRLFHPFDLRR